MNSLNKQELKKKCIYPLLCLVLFFKGKGSYKNVE